MLSMLLNELLLICSIIVIIESRRSLRDYVVSQNNFNVFGSNPFSVYDPSDNNLICRLESTNNLFNPLSNLISYPSQQLIGSIKNSWSPFRYEGYFSVFDDQLNKWMRGQIFERYHPQGFRFSIKYGEKYYLMENKIDSLITQIRDEKRENYILTQFSQTYSNPSFGSSKYNINVYTNDLPDPIYILALYALDSTSIKKRITFIP